MAGRETADAQVPWTLRSSPYRVVDGTPAAPSQRRALLVGVVSRLLALYEALGREAEAAALRARAKALAEGDG